MSDATHSLPFSLKAKLIIVNILLLSATIFIISIVFFINGEMILKKRILSDLTALVESKADRITTLVELNYEQASLLASRRTLRNNLAMLQGGLEGHGDKVAEMASILAEAAESVRFIDQIHVIDMNGKIVASSDPAYIGKDIVDSAAFAEGKKGLYMPDLYLEDGDLMYDIYAPMMSLQTGERVCIGVLKVDMEARRLLDLLTDYKGLGETGELYLGTRVAEDIVFLNPLRYRSDATLKLTIPLRAEHAEPMEKAVKKEEGIMTGLDYRGVEVLAAYRYVEIGDWGLVAKIDSSEIFTPIERLKWQTAIVASLALILTTAATFVYSVFMLRPLRRLQEGINIVSRGDLSHKVAVSGNDEIGRLALLFNRMTEDLRVITASRDELNKEIEKRRDTEERLKDSLRVKSDFTSKVSHELRTPLTAIKEGINIVLDGSAGDTTAEQRNFLELASRNVDRLSRLINDVLDFQSLESGKLLFNMTKNDVNEIALEARNTMQALAAKKNLKLETILEEGLPQVFCDKDKITQVFANLISNAIKFTDTGTVAVTTKSTGNVVQVSVADTGIGLGREDMRRLFQEFVQLHRDLKKKLGGSGLGLAICKEIIKAHRGKIWAESELNKGTAVHFVLPIKERRV